jgi:antirestriction protein ArdC
VALAPWIKPWTTFASAGEDQNIISKKPYNGINRVILGMSGFSSSKWASFKQWQALGANVRKGEKGTMIVFYSPIKKESINPTNGQLESSAYHCLKSYFVFNADQVEGIEIEKPAITEKPFIDVPALEKRVSDTGAIITMDHLAHSISVILIRSTYHIKAHLKANPITTPRCCMS